MLKYKETLVTFTEVPDEISLCINLTQCPCNCPFCFEPWLQSDIGLELDLSALITLMNKVISITCICFMGGDNDSRALAKLCREFKQKYPDIKLAMYSGRTYMHKELEECLDYYKIGPYMEQYGPLNSLTTNQRFYQKNESGVWIDITYKFQNRKRN